MQNIFSFMYDTVIISIVKSSLTINIYIESFYRKKHKNSTEKTFLLNDSYKEELLKDFLSPFIADTPYYYIALLDNSPEQGALPTCNKHEITGLKDLSDYQYVCVDSSWLYYTSKSDLEAQRKFSKGLEADLIFSPFTILNVYFEDKINEEESLYAFIQEDSITIAIFKNKKLLYGEHIDLSFEIASDDIKFSEDEILVDETEKNFEEEEVDDMIDLDENFNFDDNEIESLDDIEDIDTIEEIDELSTEEEPNENIQEEEKELETTQQSSQDYVYFSAIKDTLTRYYKRSSYANDFVHNIYVADSVKVGRDFKRYIEEELFINVYVRSIEPVIEVCHLAKEELGLL